MLYMTLNINTYTIKYAVNIHMCYRPSKLKHFETFSPQLKVWNFRERGYLLILSLLLFMIRKKNQFQVNSEIHQINTRQQANLHQPSVNVTKYQKRVHCTGVKLFNMLPFYIKAESDYPQKI